MAQKAIEAAQGERFKLVGKVEAGGQTIDFVVRFVGDRAVAFVGDEPDAILDLRELWWQSASQGKRVTLEQCKTWQAETKKRTEKSLADAKDEEGATFNRAMLEPNLKITETDDGFRMSNAIIEYVVRNGEKVSAARLALISEYNQLAAYQTAMTERKLPPDAAIAVNAELERRGVFPATMSMTITTPRATHEIKVSTSVEPLTDGDEKMVAEALNEIAKVEASGS
jgi:hypothetical protein